MSGESEVWGYDCCGVFSVGRGEEAGGGDAAVGSLDRRDSV